MYIEICGHYIEMLGSYNYHYNAVDVLKLLGLSTDICNELSSYEWTTRRRLTGEGNDDLFVSETGFVSLMNMKKVNIFSD